MGTSDRDFNREEEAAEEESEESQEAPDADNSNSSGEQTAKPGGGSGTAPVASMDSSTRRGSKRWAETHTTTGGSVRSSREEE